MAKYYLIGYKLSHKDDIFVIRINKLLFVANRYFI